MGQATMFLTEAARVGGATVEQMTADAREGKLKLFPMPACGECGAGQGQACEPTCAQAGTQVVWIGDWWTWHRARQAEGCAS